MITKDDLDRMEQRLVQRQDEMLAHNLNELASGVSLMLSAALIQNMKPGQSRNNLADIIAGAADKEQARRGERTVAHDFLRMLAKMIRPAEQDSGSGPRWTPIVLDGGKSDPQA